MKKTELHLDPPLIRPRTWNDPMRAETMISENGVLMARTFAALFISSGVVGALLAVGRGGESNGPLIALLTLVALLIGLGCIVAFRRLPVWVFELLTVVGTVLITAGAAAAASGAEGIYALFYVLIALLAGLFFPLRFAVSQMILAIVAYSYVLYSQDVQFATGYLIAMGFVLGTTGLTIARLRKRIEKLASNLAIDAQTDTLTGLPNRRSFDERFEVESEHAARSADPMSIAICDLDGFKFVNDRLGHEEGDEVLKRVATALRGAVRDVDAVARLGGEEFGLILPYADRDEAHRICESVRVAVRDEFADDAIALTTSCGHATFRRDGEDRALMRAADIALYRAKEHGRNVTVSFVDIAGSGDPPQRRFESSTK